MGGGRGWGGARGHGHGIENTGVNLEASFVTKKQRTNETLNFNTVCSAALID